jgi:hypothetical protein
LHRDADDRAGVEVDRMLGLVGQWVRLSFVNWHPTSQCGLPLAMWFIRQYSTISATVIHRMCHELPEPHRLMESSEAACTLVVVVKLS